jgi:glycosyltransferase involved in cell wall biosynthesis
VHELKISVITVCYNAESTIGRCIRSVIDQDHDNVEYIIIDGHSQDGTLSIINNYNSQINIIVSEPDRGIYDAMNKGIALATGNVVGILNADDFFADNTILSAVANAFVTSGADILYGDLDYVGPSGKIVRNWMSGDYKHGLFGKGWMPPHPTFYCKRELFKTFGNYSLEFGTAADYELMARFIHLNRPQIFYLKQKMVKMATGGASNKSYLTLIKVLYFDLKAMYKNNVDFPLIALVFKRLTKVKQFF